MDDMIDAGASIAAAQKEDLVNQMAEKTVNT